MSQTPQAPSISAFRNMIRQRMERQNDRWNDRVPWSLDDKYNAYEFVKAHGWKTPKVEKVATLAEALIASRSFGSRFVIKQPDLHSSRGVWLLEKIDGDRYLNLLTGQILGEGDIRPFDGIPDYWLVEEFLEPSCRGNVVPLDYKVYAFRGMITHILQMDRNIWPVRTAAFDGCFMPITLGPEIQLNPGVYRPQGHVIPLHAAEILAMASKLSREMDTAFVRIDCYDTTDGAAFGEFTFTPGSEDIGTIQYSGKIAAALDKALDGEPCPPLSGFDIDLNRFIKAVESHPGPVFHMAPEAYALTAAAALQSDSRYAQRMANHPCDDAIDQHFSLAARLVGLLNGDLPQAGLIKAAIEARTGFIVGNQRLKQFSDLAADFEKRVAAIRRGQPTP